MSKNNEQVMARAMIQKYFRTNNLCFSRADKIFLLTLLRKARDAKKESP